MHSKFGHMVISMKLRGERNSLVHIKNVGHLDTKNVLKIIKHTS